MPDKQGVATSVKTRSTSVVISSKTFQACLPFGTSFTANFRLIVSLLREINKLIRRVLTLCYIIYLPNFHCLLINQPNSLHVAKNKIKYNKIKDLWILNSLMVFRQVSLFQFCFGFFMYTPTKLDIFFFFFFISLFKRKGKRQLVYALTKVEDRLRLC